jgi:anti-sigma B factor antagonist
MSVPEMGLELEQATRGDWEVLTVRGEIDLSTSPELRDALTKLIDAGSPHVAVDLSDVRFMDSMGLGVLIGARRRVVEQEGTFALVSVEGPVRRVLDVSGLTGVFDVVGAVEDLSA